MEPILFVGVLKFVIKKKQSDTGQIEDFYLFCLPLTVFF